MHAQTTYTHTTEPKVHFTEETPWGRGDSSLGGVYGTGTSVI